MASIADIFSIIPGYNEAKVITDDMLNGEISPETVKKVLSQFQDDFIPFNRAYQNWLNDNPQNWVDNTVDAIGSIPGPTKALGAIPILLRKSNKAKLVKPKNVEELSQLREALDLGVKQGEIHPEDAVKFYQNAKHILASEEKLAKQEALGNIDKDYVKQVFKPEPIDKNYIKPQDKQYYDELIKEGDDAARRIKSVPKGISKNSGLPLFLQGDQGKLYWIENTLDANDVRHNLSNYDDIAYNANKIIHGKNAGRRIDTNNGRKIDPYKLVFEPELMKGMPKNELGYNYKNAMNKSYNEGKIDTESNPMYSEIIDFLEFMKKNEKK